MAANLDFDGLVEVGAADPVHLRGEQDALEGTAGAQPGGLVVGGCTEDGQQGRAEGELVILGGLPVSLVERPDDERPRVGGQVVDPEPVAAHPVVRRAAVGVDPGRELPPEALVRHLGAVALGDQGSDHRTLLALDELQPHACGLGVGDEPTGQPVGNLAVLEDLPVGVTSRAPHRS